MLFPICSKSMLFEHKEPNGKDDPVVGIVMEVNTLVNTDKILQEPYKLILLDPRNDRSLYSIEKIGNAIQRDGIIFSEDQKRSLIEIETAIKPDATDTVDGLPLKFLVWESDFSQGTHVVRAAILSFGIALSFVVPLILIKSEAFQRELTIQKKNLELKNEKLSEQSEYAKRTQALDRKSTRLNSSHIQKSRMPSSA